MSNTNIDTIAVFGATGKTGTAIVRQGIEKNYHIKALARNPAKMETSHQNLEVIQGDASDYKTVEETIRNTQAILVALGHTSGNDKEILTRATRNIIHAMKEHGIERLICLTGAGVDDPQDNQGSNSKTMKILLKLFAKNLLEDARMQADLVRNSGLKWTLIRAPKLVQGKKRGKYSTGYLNLNRTSKISREDVADFMIQQIHDDQYVGLAPKISY